jgi:hypothetical protein
MASVAQCCVTNFALSSKKFQLNGPQQAISRFEARFGVIPLFNRCIHRKIILLGAAVFYLFCPGECKACDTAPLRNGIAVEQSECYFSIATAQDLLSLTL